MLDETVEVGNVQIDPPGDEVVDRHR